MSRSSYSAILLLLAVVVSISKAAEINFDTNYDPEHHDGIPVISARGRESLGELDWPSSKAGDQQPAQRRAGEDDDDDNDEYDRDEQKSGSSNHDSYENPAFGESKMAARDGEDIEQFFDKHLGNQEVIEPPSSETGEIPVMVSSRHDDMDDPHMAAASSPLVSILQSLISSHKKPLIIHAEEDSAQTGGTSQTAPGGSNLSAGASKNEASYLGASPIAYVTPFSSQAGSQAASHYDQQFGQQVSAPSESSPAAISNDYGQIREIYISRRPSFLGRLQGTYNSPTPLVAAGGQTGRDISMGAASRHVVQDYQAQDYSRYPTAASYASSYQQQQQQDAPVASDDGLSTVSYGLSFGGQSLGDSDEPSQDSSQAGESAADEQSGADTEPTSYGNQMHYRNQMYRPSSTMQSYQNQRIPVGYYVPRGHMDNSQQQHYQQQYQPSSFSGARYHKDPTEYQAVQYRQPTRQQLLAQIDQQIKTNPKYQQQNEAASSLSSSHNAVNGLQRIPAKIVVKQKLTNSDLDTYSSFHSESDPYKSFTATSKIVPEKAAKIDQRARNKNQNLLSGPLSKSHMADSNGGRVALGHHRVRRDDADERDADEADDDGVWVDDDDDDDGRQQSSDVNETSQEPNQEDKPQHNNRQSIVSQPHGYELSPEEYMVYPG